MREFTLFAYSDLGENSSFPLGQLLGQYLFRIGGGLPESQVDGHAVIGHFAHGSAPPLGSMEAQAIDRAFLSTLFRESRSFKDKHQAQSEKGKSYFGHPLIHKGLHLGSPGFIAQGVPTITKSNQNRGLPIFAELKTLEKSRIRQVHDAFFFTSVNCLTFWEVGEGVSPGLRHARAYKTGSFRVELKLAQQLHKIRLYAFHRRNHASES